MRILYHHRTLGDGAEGIHIHGMVSAFRSLGHDVTVVSMAHPAGAGRGDDGALAAVRRALPSGLGEAARLAANVPEYVMVRRALTRQRPDVIYKRHALFDVAVGAAASHHSVPIVLEVNALHSLASMRQFEPIRLARLAEDLERTALRSARLVVAVSTPLADHIKDLGGPNVPVLVVPNGVDSSQFDPARHDGRLVRAQHGLTDRFVIGWTGVLRSWHGLEILLQAVVCLPEAELLVVGDGPERPALEQMARALGVADRLHITGRVRHEDVPSHAAAFDVAVAADDRTGFASPMKVVEYMSLARPVVVPRLPNFSDLVRHNSTGLQFNTGDADDLTSQLRALASSRDLRERLGRAARDEVLVRLNWEANARTILAALTSRVAQARRAS